MISDKQNIVFWTLPIFFTFLINRVEMIVNELNHLEITSCLTTENTKYNKEHK